MKHIICTYLLYNETHTLYHISIIYRVVFAGCIHFENRPVWYLDIETSD